MIRCERLVALLLVCSVGWASGGCTTMKRIRPASPGGQATTLGDLKGGDTVEVRTTSGQTARFVVLQIEGDTIIAPDGVRYANADILELKRRSFSMPRTVGLAAGIFGGVFLIVAAAAAAALDGLLGSGG